MLLKDPAISNPELDQIYKESLEMLELLAVTMKFRLTSGQEHEWWCFPHHELIEGLHPTTKAIDQDSIDSARARARELASAFEHILWRKVPGLERVYDDTFSFFMMEFVTRILPPTQAAETIEKAKEETLAIIATAARLGTDRFDTASYYKEAMRNITGYSFDRIVMPEEYKLLYKLYEIFPSQKGDILFARGKHDNAGATTLDGKNLFAAVAGLSQFAESSIWRSFDFIPCYTVILRPDPETSFYPIAGSASLAPVRLASSNFKEGTAVRHVFRENHGHGIEFLDKFKRVEYRVADSNANSYAVALMGAAATSAAALNDIEHDEDGSLIFLSDDQPLMRKGASCFKGFPSTSGTIPKTYETALRIFNSGVNPLFRFLDTAAAKLIEIAAQRGDRDLHDKALTFAKVGTRLYNTQIKYLEPRLKEFNLTPRYISGREVASPGGQGWASVSTRLTTPSQR